jgi:hypothetical protein
MAFKKGTPKAMRKLVFSILMVSSLPCLVAESFKPYWWNERHPDGVSAGYGFPMGMSEERDGSPAVRGHLKQAVAAAVEYLDDSLEGGAGPLVSAFKNQRWFVDNNYNNEPLAVEQLKAVVKVFYDRIAEVYPSRRNVRSPDTAGWKASQWDTDWMVEDGYELIDTTRYPAGNRWATANKDWRVVGVDSPYPWAQNAELDSDRETARIGQLKAFFSFELPQSVVTASPNGKTLRRVPFPYGVERESSEQTQEIDYLYSPKLGEGEKAPLLIVFPGGPSSFLGQRSVNQGAFLQWCKFGSSRAHCLIMGSASGGIVTAIPEVIESVINNKVPGISTSVDLDRIYLYGYSYGTLTVSRLLDLAPKRYAGAFLSGTASWAAGKWSPKQSDDVKDAYAAKIGHVPILFALGETETNGSILSVEEHEDWISRLKVHNPESFLLQSEGGHSGSQISSSNRLQNLRWLFAQRRGLSGGSRSE